MTPRLDTDAISGALELHGVDVLGVPDPIRLLVCPTHRGIFPEIVGFAFTVMVSEELHPARFV